MDDVLSLMELSVVRQFLILNSRHPYLSHSCLVLEAVEDHVMLFFFIIINSWGNYYNYLGNSVILLCVCGLCMCTWARK